MAAEYRVDYYTGETFYNENMSFRPDIYNAIKAEELPPLLRLSSYDRESQDDIIVYTWDKQSVTKKEKIEMRKNNDFSYRQKALFKKVGSYNAGYGKINYIYKAINAWGDGKWANEFYATPEESVIDNGFIKVNELKVTDAQIMANFDPSYIQASPTEQVADAVDERLANEIVDEENISIETINNISQPEDIVSLDEAIDEYNETDWKEEDNNDTCNPF